MPGMSKLRRDVRGYAGAFVAWGALAVSVVASLLWVLRISSPVPIMDEMDLMSEAYAGVQPIGLAWLFHPYDGYPMILPKLILVLFGGFSNMETYLPRILSVLMVGIGAGCFLKMIHTRTGKLFISDALVPLVLLGGGNYEMLVYGHMVITACLVLIWGILLLQLAGGKKREDWWVLALAAAVVGVMPLCGWSGFVGYPLMAFWLGVLVTRQFRHGLITRKWAVVAVSGLGFGLLCEFAVLSGLLSAGDAVVPPVGLQAVVRTLTEFLSLGIGSLTLARSWWPFSGYFVALLVLVTMVTLTREIKKRKSWWGASGTVVVGCMIFITQSLAVAWGRSSCGDGAGFAGRYIPQGALLTCLVYVGWRFQGMAGVGSFVRWAMFLAVLYGVNRDGILRDSILSGLGNNLAGVNMLISQGRSVPEIASESWPFLGYSENRVRRTLQYAADYRGGWGRQRTGTPTVNSPNGGVLGFEYPAVTVVKSRLVLSGVLATGSIVRAVSLDSRSGTVVAGCDDGSLVEWNIRTGSKKWSVGAHDGPVAAVRVVSGMSGVITAGWDGRARIWALPGLLERGVFILPGPVTALSEVVAGGDFYCGGSRGEVWGVVPSTGRITSIVPVNDGQVCAVEAPVKGRSVIFGGWSPGTARITRWISGGKQAPIFSMIDGGTVTSIVLMKEGSVVACGSWDGRIRFISEGGGRRLLSEVQAHAGPINGLAGPGAGDELYSCGMDGRVFRIEYGGKPPEVLATGAVPIRSIACGLDGTLILACGKDVIACRVLTH